MNKTAFRPHVNVNSSYRSSRCTRAALGERRAAFLQELSVQFKVSSLRRMPCGRKDIQLRQVEGQPGVHLA